MSHFLLDGGVQGVGHVHGGCSGIVKKGGHLVRQEGYIVMLGCVFPQGWCRIVICISRFFTLAENGIVGNGGGHTKVGITGLAGHGSIGNESRHGHVFRLSEWRLVRRHGRTAQFTGATGDPGGPIVVGRGMTGAGSTLRPRAGRVGTDGGGCSVVCDRVQTSHTFVGQGASGLLWQIAAMIGMPSPPFGTVVTGGSTCVRGAARLRQRIRRNTATGATGREQIRRKSRIGRGPVRRGGHGGSDTSSPLGWWWVTGACGWRLLFLVSTTEAHTIFTLAGHRAGLFGLPRIEAAFADGVQQDGSFGARETIAEALTFRQFGGPGQNAARRIHRHGVVRQIFRRPTVDAHHRLVVLRVRHGLCSTTSRGCVSFCLGAKKCRRRRRTSDDAPRRTWTQMMPFVTFRANDPCFVQKQ